MSPIGDEDQPLLVCVCLFSFFVCFFFFLSSSSYKCANSFAKINDIYIKPS
jgi:hypothetical protein